MSTTARPFLSYAFRPFFLLGGAFAVLGMLQWILVVRGTPWPPAAGYSTVQHAHEMNLGFAGAAVAGFLLTAVATWTGRPPLRGLPLAVLVAAWLAGRAAMLSTAGEPLVALLDLAFPVLLATLLSREVLAAGNRRNYGIAGIAWVLAALTATYHAAAGGLLPEGQDAETERIVVNLMLQLLLLLITVIAGRVVPSFTGNWLRARGVSRLPLSRPWLEPLVIALTAAAGIGYSVLPDSAVSAALCVCAGLAHGLRLSGWRGLSTVREPLVFVLHGAYAWLSIGYLLLGAVVLLGPLGLLPLPATAALHALAVGAVGGMILAMMSRVALGHTGRPLTAARLTVAAYLLLGLAALTRVLGPALPVPGELAYDIPAGLWMLSFALFVAHYWPILTGPRAG